MNNTWKIGGLHRTVAQWAPNFHHAAIFRCEEDKTF